MTHVTTILLSIFLTLTSSLPIASSHALPTVQLLTLGPSTSRFYSSSQDSFTNNGGHIITLPLGTSLSSLAQSPLLLQGIEILGVQDAALDDVQCKANIGWSSKGVMIGVRDGMVMLDELRGSVVRVTGLSCWVGSGRMVGRDGED